MELLRDFEFNGKSYVMLGFKVPPFPHSEETRGVEIRKVSKK